ncbi:MAG TPA: T9SS type A sorting domain-containing protein [Bacteroidetes bacterium]|nr:T9SS type A sorting domain-containing protein [Bacteroidota bacterium]
MNMTTCVEKLHEHLDLLLSKSDCFLGRPLLFAFFALHFSAINTHAQGWQQLPEFNVYDFAKDALPTPDGGYLIGGHSGPGADFHDVYLLKLDPFGNEQWRKTLGGPLHDSMDDMLALPDGSFLIVGTTFSFGNGGSDLWLVKVGKKGEVIWQKTFGTTALEFGRQAVQTSDGGFAITGRYHDVANDVVEVLVIKTDADGNEEWTDVFGGADEDEAWGITETTDQQLVMLGTTRSFGQGERDIYLLSTGLDGTFNWQQTFGGTADELATGLIETSDGALLIGGATFSFGAGDSDVFLVKTDLSGNEIWSHTYGGSDGEWGAYLLELPTGEIAFAGSTRSFGNALDDIFLVKTTADGSLIWQRSFGQGRKDIPHSIELTPDGGFLLSAHSRTDNPADGTILTSQSFVVRTTPDGLAFSNYFRGKIFVDENGDCTFQNNEIGFENWLLKATSTSGLDRSFYGLTDTAGNYSILADTGSYLLQLVPPNEYWQPCENNIPLAFASFYDTLNTDFALNEVTACPQLEVDVAAPVLRPCEDAFYQVRYCNNGTVAANPTLDISIDSSLTYLASGIPLAGQNGQVLHFDIGSLEPGDCGSFPLRLALDCGAEWGRTHCLQAHIFPDGTCLPDPPQWDGSNIEVAAFCESDSVGFIIKNTGAGDMAEPLYSIIIEDQIVGRGLNYRLLSGDSTIIKHPASGKTIRLQTRQTPGHPGKSLPSVSVEGCTAGGPISKGFVTMWPEDDADPFKSIDCRESVYNVPAGDKLAFPKGIGGAHLIQPNTDIEYFIHFQNTGEDSISTVVIQDTLSQWLDITTLRPGAGSHPYKLEISNMGILQFTFDNINLTDSLSDETASHGFIKFRVAQRPDMPADSLIINRSCVTFDYGSPEAKPYYFHTLDQPQVFSISDVSLCTGGDYDGVAVQSDTTFFELNELPAYDSLQFTNISVLPVYDLFFSDTTCENEPYFFVDEWLDMPGIYESPLMTVAGCDSLLTLELAMLEVPVFSFQDSVCIGLPYFFNGQTITEAGVYDAFFASANGCDSIVTLQLSFSPLPQMAMDTAVELGSFFLGVQIFGDTVLVDTTFGEMTCDTIVNWHVDGFTGTSEPSLESAIHVSPNPTSGEIRISVSDPSLSLLGLTVFNAQGQRLQALPKEGEFIPPTPPANEKTISTLHWPAGIYLLMVETERAYLITKVLKR